MKLQWKDVGNRKSEQRGVKLQWKDAGGRKSEQHLNHPQSKPLSVQSTAGYAHQDSDSRATNGHARMTINLPKNPCLRGISHHHLWLLRLSFVYVTFVPQNS